MGISSLGVGLNKKRAIIANQLKSHVLALALVLLCVVTMIFAFTIFSSSSNDYPSAINPVLKSNYLSLPLKNLLRETVASDRVRALNSDGLNHTSAVRNQTVVRKIEYGRREKLERGLGGARMAILRAVSSENSSSPINDADFVLDRSVYLNPRAFYQSYKEMERRFKVYVYKEGELPISHTGPCKNIYTSEGRFIHEMEHSPYNRFRTDDGEEAHVYFMPFSVAMMVKYIYKNKSFDMGPFHRYIGDYVDSVARLHPFWNRTNGADHFMVACHDWGPLASEGNPFLYNTSIRLLCNANTSEGFNLQKDVSLPEIHLLNGDIPDVFKSTPPPSSLRPYLAFFAGGVHGPIRPVLLSAWQNRDPSLPVFEYLPQISTLSYHSYMLKSKFCLCPSGYEVASPRLVEAIYAGCVPVILSRGYALPFSDVLRWDAISVTVDVDDIPRLKEILLAVPEEKYRRLQAGLGVVRKHFTFNHPAKRFDVFHMLLHSIWLRRINFGGQLGNNNTIVRV